MDWPRPDNDGAAARRFEGVTLAVLGCAALAAVSALLLDSLSGNRIPRRRVANSVIRVVLPPPPPKQVVLAWKPQTSPVIKQFARPHLPQPKRPDRASRSLTIDRSATPDVYDIPRGASDGILLGGDGQNGRGGGCWGGQYFLFMITSQLRAKLIENEQRDHEDFQLRATLWFGPTGHVTRKILNESTGDATLDARVLALIDDVNLGGTMPACLQPVMVRVKRPWREMSVTPHAIAYRAPLPSSSPDDGSVGHVARF